MVAANKQHLPSSSTSSAKNPKNPKNPNPSSDAAMKNYTSSFASTSTSAAAASSSSQPDSAAILPLSVDGSDEEDLLRQSEFLTREEVLQRRSRRVKQLARYYRSQYWALMEEVRAKHRDYYWEYGKSPFTEEGEEEEAGWSSGRAVAAERSGENGGRRLGLGLVRNGKGSERDVKWNRCGFQGCKAKAMALTSFCHLHILSDPKQKLYKPCTYVVKRFSTQTGTITCAKPVLRAVVPTLCTVHFQKAQRHVSQALKKAGFSGSSSSKPAPKLHVIIAEYVRQIQAKRKEAQKAAVGNAVVEEEHVS